MRVEIARLHKEIGATMIYVTHDQTEAMTLANKIVVLRDGKIEQVGKPMDLYRDPDNKFVGGFIGSPSMNFLDGEIVSSGKVAHRRAWRRISNLPIQTCRRMVARCSLGLRPEHLGTGSRMATSHMVRADRGAWWRLLRIPDLAPTGERIIVEERGDYRTEAGASVGVTFPIEKAYLFDAQTDLRLR